MAEGSFPIDRFEALLGNMLGARMDQIASVFGLETFDTVKLFHPKLELKAEEADFRKIVRTFLRKHALANAKSVSDAIRADVRKVLQDQFKEGFGEREAVRRVAAILAKGKAYSIAQRIARTESHTAATLGQNKAAEASGVDLVKEWGATEDHRTRPDHAAADNQTREMWDRFNVGESLMLFPGEPNAPAKQVINCRCVALYWPRAVAPYAVTSSGVVPPPKPKPAVTDAKPKPNDEQLDTDFPDLPPPTFIPPDPSPDLWDRAREFAWDALIYTRAKLSLDSYNAVVAYQGSAYRDWNLALRTDAVLDRRMYRNTLAMDKGFDAFQLTKAGTVWRGGKFELGGMIWDKKTGKIPIGTQFTDNGFISVSSSKDTAESFARGGFVFRIDLQEGTKLLGVKPLKLGNQHEAEMVLPRGTRFEVVRELANHEYLIRIVGATTRPIKEGKKRKGQRHSDQHLIWMDDDIIVHQK